MEQGRCQSRQEECSTCPGLSVQAACPVPMGKLGSGPTGRCLSAPALAPRGVQSSLSSSAAGKAARALSGRQAHPSSGQSGQWGGGTGSLPAWLQAFSPRYGHDLTSPCSGLSCRGIPVKVHRMRQELEEIPWDEWAVCSALSLLPATLSTLLLSHTLPTWLPLSYSPLLAGSALLSSVLPVPG